MNKDIIIFYLKRHVLGIVGLVLGIGFVAGGFVLLAEAKKGLEVSQNSMAKAESDRKTIQDSQIRVDSKNLETLSLVIGDFEKFNKESGKVFSTNNLRHQAPNDFINYLIQSVAVLNQKAKSNLVQVPRDIAGGDSIGYSFTFASVINEDPTEDKIPELQIQLEHIKEISDVLLESRIQSIEKIQRSRVTLEDFKSGASISFFGREAYTNSIGVVRPYRLQFQCLSDGVANVLSGFAERETFFVVRALKVAPGSGGLMIQGSGQLGDDGMSDDGMSDDGMGGDEEGLDGGSSLDGSEGGGVQGMTLSANMLPLPYIQYLVSQKLAAPPATNVIGESLLTVDIDLDVISRLASE